MRTPKLHERLALMAGGFLMGRLIIRVAEAFDNWRFWSGPRTSSGRLAEALAHTRGITDAQVGKVLTGYAQGGEVPWSDPQHDVRADIEDLWFLYRQRAGLN